MTIEESLGIRFSNIDWKYPVSLFIALSTSKIFDLLLLITSQFITIPSKKYIPVDNSFYTHDKLSNLKLYHNTIFLNNIYGILISAILVLSITFLLFKKVNMSFHLKALIAISFAEAFQLALFSNYNNSFYASLTREALFYFLMFESFNYFVSKSNNRIKGLLSGYFIALILRDVLLLGLQSIYGILQIKSLFTTPLKIGLSLLFFFIGLRATKRLFKLDLEANLVQ